MKEELLQKLAIINDRIKRQESNMCYEDNILSSKANLICLYATRNHIMDELEKLEEEKPKDLGENYNYNKNLFDTIKDCQSKRGTITNAWLISLILTDEGQYLTESDKVALKRLLKRIEREHAKSGL